jgi:hypothetical protein
MLVFHFGLVVLAIVMTSLILLPYMAKLRYNEKRDHLLPLEAKGGNTQILFM